MGNITSWTDGNFELGADNNSDVENSATVTNENKNLDVTEVEKEKYSGTSNRRSDRSNITTTTKDMSKIVNNAFILTTESRSRIHTKFSELKCLDIMLTYQKNMNREQLWREGSKALSYCSENIIDFAQLIPDFKKLTYYDKMTLLQFAAFEMAIIRMSRFTNSFLDRIIYGNSLLKSTAFHTKSEVDIKLIEMAANLAKDITDLRLTDLELALYSAVVLFDCDDPELDNEPEIKRLHDLVINTLKAELELTHTQLLDDGVTVFDHLMKKISQLREAARMHLKALADFTKSHPDHDFIKLYKDLFEERSAECCKIIGISKI